MESQRNQQEAYISIGHHGAALQGVVLDRSTPESFAAFEKAVLKLKEVLDCVLVAGDFDYLLKIRVRDMADSTSCTGTS